MEDLRDIISLGFSGADIAPAMIIAFTLAILPRKKRSSWFLGAIAILLDRLVWPVTGMALAGSNIHSIYASIGALGKTFVDDLGLYVVRYLGLVVMIAFFIMMRANINAKLDAPKAKPAHA
jgi:hypothetical protein